MSNGATGVHQHPPSNLPIPTDRVLGSGAVTFPGAFDQHGCPLVMFPLGEQHKLGPDLGKEEVAQFIAYFLRLHNKYQEKESLVSVAVDLRKANLTTARFFAETLLLLERHKRTVHTVYVVQPKKRDVQKMLLKLLLPSSSKNAVLFKRVFLKELCELCNYIDRSQLTPEMGGYLVYCHQSWMTFLKEIDAFVQEFVAVVQRLPSCIATLQTLSWQPVPNSFEELRKFCSSNEAQFHELRRELGLDRLLRHCEIVLEKLHCPENEPSYQAMAGTTFFTHTTYDMLQNYSRIMAAVEKVELLWQQAFSKAHLQLQVMKLQKEAQQMMDLMNKMTLAKLQPYRIEIARDVRTAEKLKMEYEMSIYKPGMAVVHQADDLIRTLTKMGVCGGPNAQAEWIQALESRKEKFHSSLELPHHTLRAISDFYYCYTKSKNWYSVVLRETFLQDLLWSGSNNSPRLSYFLEGPDSGSSAWKQSVWAFLRRNPSPEMEELVQLAHLSNVVPDGQLQQTGKQLSHRCMILRKLLMSPGAVPLHELQLALQWQYEFLRDNQNDPVESVKSNKPFAKNICQERTHGLLGQVNSSHVPSKHRVMDTGALSKCMTGISVKECDPKLTERVQESTSAKPPSLSSFDSGFGPGSAHLDNAADKETCVSKEASRPVKQPQVQENISRVSDSEDVDMVGCNSRPSIQIIPKIAVDSLNFEIKVKRSATLPKNPWLSLPVDDLESSYTVTITPSMASADRSLLKTPTVDVSKFKNQRVQTGTPISNLTLSAKQQKSLCGAGELKSSVSILQPQDCFEDSDLSPIRHVLSSTITDGREKSNCTTESVPTLLWDSYDLHNAKQDSCDGLVKSLTEISLNNWELKEQEGLREVEDMLDRAAGILQEEESVLAQEGLLDVLLRTENTNQHWTLWGDDQPSLTTMSSKELMEAGVDFDDTTLLSHTTQDKSNTFSFAVTDTLPTDSLVALQSESCNLLQELRDLDILEEQITEENLKIQELRQSECVESLTELQKVHSVNKKREQFLKELKKEKLEVERMERSLNKEMAKGNSRKKKISEACKVVKCSVMERATSLKDEETKSMCQSQSHIEDISHKNIVINGETPECTTSLVQVGEGKNTNALGGRVLCDASPDSNLVSSSAGLISYDPACVENSELIRKSFVDVHETLDGVMDVPLTPSFDPGGEGVGPPVPKPRKLTLFNKPDPDLALPLEELQVKTEPSVRLGPLPKPRDRSTKPPSLSSEHEEHANNNNNKQKPPETKPTKSESHFSPATKPEVPQVSNQEAPCRHPAEEMEQPLEEHVEESGCHRVADKLYPSQLCSTVTLADMSEFGVPIVLDTGSGLMKAGFADQELPTTIFPTVIGFPKYEEIMNGSSERELYIGHEAQHMRGVLTLRHPMKHGIIRNWHEMEKIWHHSFQQLRVDPEEHPVMLTEAALNPRENRERMVELMFEEFSVPFTYVAMQAVLALYAAGRTTGVVFDSGDGVSHSVPVFEGYCLTHAVQRFPLAGMDVTLQLRKLLQEQGVTLRTTAELEIVREMKERCCTVAQDYEAELAQGGAASSEMFYTMPDGHVVRLTTERFRAPEILFKPELIGRDLYGMHESVFKSVLQSDLDLRRSFISNIILSGGNTLLQGLPQRLQKEVSSLVPAELVRCVRVSSPEDRDFSVWSGGAALASLPSFASTWISRNEYDEFGPQIVFRKCF